MSATIKRSRSAAGRRDCVCCNADLPAEQHGDKWQNWWLWTAVVQETDGRCWLDFEVGDRSENTFQRLYARLPEAELYRSDACGVYASWLPPGRYVAGKGGAVNRNEGLHSWLRSKLNRLVRNTKGYTKSVAMLVYALTLLVADWTAKVHTSLC